METLGKGRGVGLVVRLLVVGAAIGGCSKRSDGWVVFSGAAAGEMRKQCARDFPENLTGEWAPSPRDIHRVEPKVTEAIAAALAKRSAPDQERGRSGYYRQYAGFYRNGRRVLYVNGLRKAEVDEASKSDPQRVPWRTEVVAMCDGGPGYFGAVVDVETGAVDHLEFNGPGPPA